MTQVKTLGQYRVWNAINPPERMEYYEVATPAEGAKLIEKLTRHQLRIPSIHSNAFGLDEFLDGEWLTWYNEDGEDVDEAFGLN